MSRNKWCVAPGLSVVVLLAVCVSSLPVVPDAQGATRSRRPADRDVLALNDAPADVGADADLEPAPRPRRNRPATDAVDDRRDSDDDRAAADDREYRRRRVNEDDWFRDRSLYGRDSGGGDGRGFPSGEVHDFVIANARAATARAVFRRAESALNAAVRKAKRDFQNSQELKEALVAEREAWQAFQDARRDALATVVGDPRYQAILSLRQDLSKQIEARRQALDAEGLAPVQVSFVSHPLGQDLLSLAEMRMSVASDARQMERAALEDNEDLRQARAKLSAANARITQLKQDFEVAIREDDDLRRAREVLEDAKIARLTATAYLRGAMMAAEEAVDFAYWLHRYDRTTHFDPYAYYGYGYVRY